MVVTAQDLNRERHWICARRMSQRRRDLGLTQGDVVDRLGALGSVTTNRTLSAMEHGQGVDVGRLPELAVALDCTVTYLLGLTDEPGCWTPDDVQVDGIVDLTARVPQPLNGAQMSWILGPDIPDRSAAQRAGQYGA